VSKFKTDNKTEGQFCFKKKINKINKLHQADQRQNRRHKLPILKIKEE
jgi:hypothetical protein